MILAFAGKAGAGKDTAGEHLVRKYHFIRTSFADPMKQMAALAFGFTDEQLYGPSESRNEPDERFPFSGTCVSCGKPCVEATKGFACVHCGALYPRHVSPRIALQTLGTEWGRRLYTNVWVDATMRKIAQADWPHWAITDLRFPNELQAVRAAGGRTVQIVRPSHESGGGSHVSETALAGADFDVVLVNDGTIEDLHRMLDNYLEAWRLEQRKH